MAAAEERRQREALRNERHAHILDLLARQSSASVAQIRQVTGASAATVRRDLADLESGRLLRRIRGGATAVPSSSSLDEAFALRRARNARAKGAIALAAARLVPANSSVFLNDGSTSLAVAEELARTGRPLWVATSALNIAERLASFTAIEVLVLGGALRGSSFGTVGPLAQSALHQLRADFAFISADGIDEDGVLLNNLDDGAVARAMVANARHAVVVADAQKYASNARVQVAGWDYLAGLVTDDVPEPMRTVLAEHDVELHLVTP